MIKIVCVGKIKEQYFKDAIKEYQKRISKYDSLIIEEVPDSSIDDSKVALKEEAKCILSHLSIKDNVVILDINGEEYNSMEFSSFLNRELAYNNNITFIIGSSYGIADEVKKIAKKKISFSKLTFPHQLFRLLLLEQIYRGFKIINHESYHK